MKNNFKKSLSLVLAVLMLVSSFSVMSFAATTDHTGHSITTSAAVPAVGCQNGFTESKYCNTCKVWIKQQEVAEAPHNLDGVDWKIDGTVSDCEKVGNTRYKKCKDCTYKLTEKVTNHTWEVKSVDEAAKCTDISYENKECKVCKKTVREPLEAGKHSWGDDAEAGWEVIEKATCTLDGKQQRKCTKCNEVETRTITASGHKYKPQGGKEPTCTEDGVTSKMVCVNCKDTKEGATLSKLNHKDANNDGYCDYCEGFRAEDGTICDCLCHKTSGILPKLYKVVLFIFRIFKIGQKCGCGLDHYVVD